MSDPLRREFAPTRDDAVVRSVSEVVGGPMGSRSAGHRWWTPVRGVLLVATLCLAVGLVLKAPCLDARQGPGESGRYTALCWSDVSAAYATHGFAEGTWPFTDDESVRARYAAGAQPPLAAYVAYVSQRITFLLTGSPDVGERGMVPVADLVERDDVRREGRVFTLVNWMLLAAAGLWAAGLLASIGRRRAWDAAAFAAAPVLVLFWPVAWDLLAATAVAAALWAHARGRPMATGVAIGVGSCVSPLVAVLLPPAIVVALRERRTADASVLAGSAATAWLAMAVPAWWSGSAAFEESWRGTFRGPDVGSLWLVVSQVSDWTPSRTVLLVTVALCVVAAMAVVCWLGWRRRLSLAALSLLAMVAVMGVIPTGPPSQALILLPLAALAVPSWRSLLVWQACEILHWAMLGFYVGGALAPGGGGDAAAYWWAIVMRVVGLVWLATAAVRHSRAGDDALGNEIAVDPAPQGDLVGQ